MRIRTARKIADLAAPGLMGQCQRRWPLHTLIAAFKTLFRKWRAVTTCDLTKGDHMDVGRKCTEDYFRGNRLAYQINYRIKGGGARVEPVMFKPAVRRAWIERHGEPPK